MENCMIEPPDYECVCGGQGCEHCEEQCQECGGSGVIETAPAGAVYEDDLAEYVPCQTCMRNRVAS